MVNRRWLALLTGVILILAGARAASAQPAVAEAEREFRLGYQALQAGDCTEALAHYRRSLALVARPRTLFNIATCQEQLGQIADAVASYRAFLGSAEARDAAIVETARARLDALHGRLRGRVAIESDPPGAMVQVDDDRAPRGVTPMTLALEPGTHAVRLVTADGVAIERRIEVAPDGVALLRVELPQPSAIAVQVEPRDARIELDGGGATAQGRLDASVRPGRHVLVLRRAGYQDERIVIEAVAGRTYEHRVRLRPAPPAPAPITVDLRLAPAPPRPALRWGLGGLGAVGLTAGGVMGVLALRDVGSASPADHDRGKTRALVADGLIVVGSAALVAAWRLTRRASPPATIRPTTGGRP